MPTFARPVTCPECSTTVERRNGRQVYCCKTCAKAAEHRRAKERGYQRPGITTKCSWCDKPTTQRPAEHAKGSLPFCSRACVASYRVCMWDKRSSQPWPRQLPQHQCIECATPYPTKAHSPGRCPQCRARPTACTCHRCGITFIAPRNRKACDDCKRERQRNRSRYRRRTKRWAKRRQYILERDKRRCRICRCKVNLTDPNHPRAAEIDHIIPRSKWPKGTPGVNNPRNLRLLCRTCNNQKSNGTAPRGDQLALIG